MPPRVSRRELILGAFMVEHAKSLMPGEVLYDTLTEEQPSPDALSLEESVGRKALHDMTRIVPGESKQPKIVAGQTMGAGYLCRLQQMGRTRIFVEDERAVDADWLHENQAEAGSA